MGICSVYVDLLQFAFLLVVNFSLALNVVETVHHTRRALQLVGRWETSAVESEFSVYVVRDVDNHKPGRYTMYASVSSVTVEITTINIHMYKFQ